MVFPITYNDYSMPETAKSKLPLAMIDDTFAGLGPWFASMINPIESEYQNDLKDDADRGKTMIRLGKLGGKVSGMGELLSEFVNGELRPKVKFIIPEFKQPVGSTTFEDSKTPVEKRNKPKHMMAILFQAITPWFETIPPLIKPHYAGKYKETNTKDASGDARLDLGGFIRQVNLIKILLLNYVNDQIKFQRDNKSYSATGEEEFPEGSIDAVKVEEKVGEAIVADVLDMTIGETRIPKIENGELVFDSNGEIVFIPVEEAVQQDPVQQDAA